MCPCVLQYVHKSLTWALINNLMVIFKMLAKFQLESPAKHYMQLHTVVFVTNNKPVHLKVIPWSTLMMLYLTGNNTLISLQWLNKEHTLFKLSLSLNTFNTALCIEKWYYATISHTCSSLQYHYGNALIHVNQKISIKMEVKFKIWCIQTVQDSKQYTCTHTRTWMSENKKY